MLLGNFQGRGILPIRIIKAQGPLCLQQFFFIFIFIYCIFSFSFSLCLGNGSIWTEILSQRADNYPKQPTSLRVAMRSTPTPKRFFRKIPLFDFVCVLAGGEVGHLKVINFTDERAVFQSSCIYAHFMCFITETIHITSPVDVSNTDVSKYPRISRNIVLKCFLGLISYFI